jgi:cell division septation protein DedD
MYCTKCGLEIQGGSETLCPLCNTPLEEHQAAEQGAAPDTSLEDVKLREMISDIERTITISNDGGEKSAEPAQDGHAFDLEQALSEDIPRSPEPDIFPVSAEQTDTEYEKTRAVMEQALAGIQDEPTPVPEPPRRSAMKNSAAVLLILGVVAAGIAAGYLFSPQEAPVVRRTTAPQAPEVAKPAAPQTVKMPAPAESSPQAPPSAAPAAVDALQPVKQKQELSSPVPEKTAGAASVAAAPALTPAQTPAAAKEKSPPPPKPAEPPKTAKVPVPGYYCVNVGSFKLKASTDRVCSDLKKNGYAPVVETVTLNDGNTWYRVTVGSFATRDEAARFGRELENNTNIKALVVKRK